MNNNVITHKQQSLEKYFGDIMSCNKSSGNVDVRRVEPCPYWPWDGARASTAAISHLLICARNTQQYNVVYC